MSYQPLFKKTADLETIAMACEMAVKSDQTLYFMKSLATITDPAKLEAIRPYASMIRHYDYVVAMLLAMNRMEFAWFVLKLSQISGTPSLSFTAHRLKGKLKDNLLDPNTIERALASIGVTPDSDLAVKIEPFNAEQRAMNAVQTDDIHMLQRILENNQPTAAVLSEACKLKRYEMIPLIMAASPTLITPGSCSRRTFAHFARSMSPEQFAEFNRKF